MTDEKVTVWYLITSLSVGGAERTLVELVNNLDDETYDPVVWTLTEPGPLADDLDDDIPLRSLDVAGKHDVGALFRFARQLRAEGPAILQSFLYFDNLLARLTGLVAPETTIISGVRQVPRQQSLLRATLDTVTVPLSDHFVSNSQAGADFVQSRGAPEARTHVVRNGRDLNAYADGTEPANLRSDLDIPADAPLVGTVGRLVERKGQYELVDAWPQIRRDYPNAHLLLVGDGPERAGLSTRTRELNCADSVHLLGSRDDVPDLLAALDVFVFPSHYEGLPGAVQEAMAAGLPIVVTPVDGSAELITDGETGLYTPVRDSTTLAERVGSLLSDRSLATRLGATAQKEAFDRYTIDAMVNGFSDVYRTALDGRSR